MAKLLASEEEFFEGFALGLEFRDAKVQDAGGIKPYIDHLKEVVMKVEPFISQRLNEYKGFLFEKANCATGLSNDQKKDLGARYWDRAMELAILNQAQGLGFALSRELDSRLTEEKDARNEKLVKIFNGDKHYSAGFVKAIGDLISSKVITENSEYNIHLIDLAQQLKMSYMNVDAEEDRSSDMPELADHKRRSIHMAKQTEGKNSAIIVGMSHLTEINDELSMRQRSDALSFSYIVIGDTKCMVSYAGREDEALLEKFKECGVTVIDVVNFKKESDVGEEAYDRAAAFIMRDVNVMKSQATKMTSVLESIRSSGEVSMQEGVVIT